MHLHGRNLASEGRLWAASDNSDILHPTITPAQTELREHCKKRKLEFVCSKRWIPTRRLDSANSSNIDFIPPACPVRRCVCVLWSQERCVVRGGGSDQGCFGRLYVWLRKIGASASIKTKSWTTSARLRCGIRSGQTLGGIIHPL